MKTALLLLGPLTLTASYVLATVGSPLLATVQVPALLATANAAPPADLLLSLGPYGALVWGAYVLGRGVKVTVVHEVPPDVRELLRELSRGGRDA